MNTPSGKHKSLKTEADEILRLMNGKSFIECFIHPGWSESNQVFDFDGAHGCGLEVEALAADGDLGKVKSLLEGMGLSGVKSTVIGLNDAICLACNICIDVAANGGRRMSRENLRTYLDYGVPAESVEAFTEAPAEGGTVQARVFGDLVRYFAKQMSGKLQYVDDLHLGNWEFAWREGEIALVLLDCGL